MGMGRFPILKSWILPLPSENWIRTRTANSHQMNYDLALLPTGMAKTAIEESESFRSHPAPKTTSPYSKTDRRNFNTNDSEIVWGEKGGTGALKAN